MTRVRKALMETKTTAAVDWVARETNRRVFELESNAFSGPLELASIRLSDKKWFIEALFGYDVAFSDRYKTVLAAEDAAEQAVVNFCRHVVDTL